MCTVTYVPKGENKFLFTSNRDEAPKRSASEVVKGQRGQKMLLFPRDRQAKGTWIAISDTQQLVCILNGGFYAHERRAGYRMSRGLMALQFFDYDDAPHFFREFQFEGMEPFTFIIYDKGKLYDLHWDEEDPNIRELSTTEYHIWASSTLYTRAQQDQRKQWFEDWKQQQNYSKESILDFHQNTGDGDPFTNLVMNRHDIVRTTSITSIDASEKAMDMQFRNLLKGSIEAERLELIQ